MKDFVERRVGRYTIRIDRLLCVGFGDCITAAEELFEFDADGIAAFKDAATPTEERALDACRACPVDALIALDEGGAQVAP